MITFETQALGQVPVKGCIPYWGTIAELPPNWKPCDGTTYGSVTVPDMRGLFIKGAVVEGDIGTTGGAATHKHVGAAHTHNGDAHTHDIPNHKHVLDYTNVLNSITGLTPQPVYRNGATGRLETDAVGGTPANEINDQTKIDGGGGNTTSAGSGATSSAGANDTTTVDGQPPFYTQIWITRIY